jgi:hypothetical protein
MGGNLTSDLTDNFFSFLPSICSLNLAWTAFLNSFLPSSTRVLMRSTTM